MRARSQPSFHSHHFSGHGETPNSHGRDGEKTGRTDAGTASGEGDQTSTTAPADVQGGNHLTPRGPEKTEVWKAVKGRCSQREHPVESGLLPSTRRCQATRSPGLLQDRVTLCPFRTVSPTPTPAVGLLRREAKPARAADCFQLKAFSLF